MKKINPEKKKRKEKKYIIDNNNNFVKFLYNNEKFISDNDILKNGQMDKGRFKKSW